MADDATQDAPQSKNVNEAAAAIGSMGLLDGIGPVDDREAEDAEAEAPEGEEPEGEDVDDFEEEDDFEDVDEESDDEVEEDEADDEADDSEGSPTYTVKVDGEEIEVTLDEALSGYQRHKDYTRKTMELADQRQSLGSKVEELAALQAQYSQNLDTVQKMYQLPEVDWAQVKKEDPDNYTTYREQYDQRKSVLDAIEAEKAQLAEQMEARRQELQEINREKLHAAIPEWSDPDTRDAESEKMVEYATTTYGWEPKDLEQAVDYRVFVMLRDAMKWREHTTKGQDVKETVKKKRRKTKTLKPGSPDRKTSSTKKKSSKATKAAQQRLRDSGSVHDAAAVIGGLID